MKEFDPPLSGPRRLRFDASGTLWIPAFGDGALVKLDPKTMKYTTYEMPRLSPGESEAPYALAVDPRRQDVWITANMSDRLFRFIPKDERFITYRLPTRGTYTREFFFELGNGDRRLLRDVISALQKIDDGSFGNCERCGEEISEKRLEALPFARYCIECQRAVEEEERSAAR